ncbi:MAG: hypothetical protein ABS76_10920 [Pelagibacterium sp. SCN 64-44]|nr:MAG: hypothetical protein ABS76_10920 [Pelagibacterium sp. SCN 64-44]
MTGLLVACVSRPVGDFGRAQPGVLHDQVMPYIGGKIAANRGEPVSNLNQTDQEREMHDRTWRFLVAAHSRDWMFDTTVELQRTRIGPAKDHKYTPERYYSWLRTTPYQSSPTRYATVGRHILADIDTLPTTFRSICAVEEVDRQRRVALAELPGIESNVAANVQARRVENQWHVDWFVRALNYRYQSYAYALDHLLVETPHEQSMAVDENLRRMRPWVDRANRGDFCSGSMAGGGGSGANIPSRFQTMVPDREVIPQK